MECLDTPVDPRLRSLIRKTTSPVTHSTIGRHLDILYKFGKKLDSFEKPIGISEISFGIELASPATTGGISVILDRPAPRQTYDDGYIVGVEKCKTLKAVRDLVSLASNQRSRLDNVSVFDTIPFVTTDGDDDLIERAHKTFSRMVRAKALDVVLYCAQGNSTNDIVKLTRSLGVGLKCAGPSLCYKERIDLQTFH